MRPAIHILQEARAENAERAYSLFAFEEVMSDHEYARRAMEYNTIGKDLSKAINQLEEL